MVAAFILGTGFLLFFKAYLNMVLCFEGLETVVQFAAGSIQVFCLSVDCFQCLTNPVEIAGDLCQIRFHFFHGFLRGFKGSADLGDVLLDILGLPGNFF